MGGRKSSENFILNTVLRLADSTESLVTAPLVFEKSVRENRNARMIHRANAIERPNAFLLES